MDLGEFVKLTGFITRKNKGEYRSPSEITSTINLVQIKYFDDLLPDVHVKKNGYYEENAKVMAKLYPFKKVAALAIDTDGKADYPEGFVYPSSMRKKMLIQKKCGTANLETKYLPVRMIDDDKLNHVLTSKIIGPKEHKRAYFCMYSDHIKCFPESLKEADFTYLRRPVDVVYATTIVNGRPEYNSAGSTQLEWPEITHFEIMMRVLQIFGVHMREQDLQAAITQLKEQ